MRLALARLAAEPALAHGGAGLAPATRDLAAALRHALADPCPDINKVGSNDETVLVSDHGGPVSPSIQKPYATTLPIKRS